MFQTVSIDDVMSAEELISKRTDLRGKSVRI